MTESIVDYESSFEHSREFDRYIPAKHVAIVKIRLFVLAVFEPVTLQRLIDSPGVW